jgi:hypothetical protein
MPCTVAGSRSWDSEPHSTAPRHRALVSLHHLLDEERILPVR